MITLKRLKHLLHYDPETGVWTWRNPPKHSRHFAGGVAGFINSHGYRIFHIDYEYYRSARLAYFYMTGEWPIYEMDHINHDRSDDRWENLRNVHSAQNLLNRRYDFFRGVRASGRKYEARVSGEYLGSFDRLATAIAVRDFALWYHGNTIDPYGERL